MSGRHPEYYDSRAESNLQKFVQGNRRIFSAWRRIQSLFADRPGARKVVDFGCGIGEMSWRASMYWPNAQVTGIDPSPASIELAAKLFGNSRVTFQHGGREQLDLLENVDLLFMIDVLEHIHPGEREPLFKCIRRTLADQAIVVVTYPTPEHLEYLRRHAPAELQPIDEDINTRVLSQFADETATVLTHFDYISVWRGNDYAHAVFQRSGLFDGERSVQRTSPLLRMKRFVQRRLRVDLEARDFSLPDNRAIRESLVKRRVQA